jgi:hypothetical protein
MIISVVFAMNHQAMEVLYTIILAPDVLTKKYLFSAITHWCNEAS